MKRYRFITDPGHGWLEVPTNELQKLGIADQISTCSYISADGLLAYLEEDCDAPIFFQAKGWKESWIGSNGYVTPIEEVYQEHTFVRGLESYKTKGVVLSKVGLFGGSGAK